MPHECTTLEAVSQEFVTVPGVTALALQCETRSELGRRDNNEDSVFATARLAALADLVPETAIARALDRPTRAVSADRLVALALKAGGSDNISVVVADVMERLDPRDSWRT
jgi:hypothetical protein